MNGPSPNTADDFFADSRQITQAMGRAVQQALRMHKLLGHPIATWRDGQVVWIPPEEIVLDESLLHEKNGGTHPE